MSLPDEVVRSLSAEAEDLSQKSPSLGTMQTDSSDGFDEAAAWKSLGFDGPQAPCELIGDAIAEARDAGVTLRDHLGVSPVPSHADSLQLQRFALQAQTTIERTRALIFGPEDQLGPASCFNWALGAGELGYNEDSWPEALFDWVSVAERWRHPWRSETRPWKTVSLVCVQRRCAATLAPLAPRHLATLDRITSDHLERRRCLSKEEWSDPIVSRAHETEVMRELVTLAVEIAGMTPTDETPDSVAVCMRGKPDVPPNFSHWWLELPTGRRGGDGEVERVRCETYPGAPVYFSPAYHSADKQLPRGHVTVHVERILQRHVDGIASALG